jgi:hypothetical protein
MAQKNKYRRLVNYDGQYAVLSTLEDRTEKDKDGSTKIVGEREFLSVLPLAAFLCFFSRPKDVLELFQEKARYICAEWNRINSPPEMCGKRRPLSLTYDLTDKYEWKSNRGRHNERTEISIFKIQITSYGATIHSQLLNNPTISLRDLRVNKMLGFFRRL